MNYILMRINIDYIAWIILGFLIFCVWLLFKDKEFNNKILHRNVPNLLTSLGVFGTFLGVYQALQNFDDTNIDNSIVLMISAMKGAFLTSVMGLGGAIIYKGIDAYKNRNVTVSNFVSDSVTGGINHVVELFNDGLMDKMGENFKELNESIKGLHKWCDNYKSQVEDNTKLLQQTAQNYQETLDKTVIVFDKIQNSVENISESTTKMIISSESLQSFASSIDESMDNIDTHLERLQELDIETVNQNIDDLFDNIDNSSKMVEQQTENTEKITSHIETLSSNLDKNMNSLNENINNIQKSTEDLKQAMNWATSLSGINIGDQLDNALTKINNTSQNLQEFPNKLEIATTKSIDEIGKMSQQNLGEFSRKLASISEQFANDYQPLTEKLRQVMEIANQVKNR